MLLQILQDFFKTLLFGPEIDAKLMEKWHTSYYGKVIREAEILTSTPVLQSLLKSVRNQYNNESSEDHPVIQLKAKLNHFESIRSYAVLVMELNTAQKAWGGYGQ